MGLAREKAQKRRYEEQYEPKWDEGFLKNTVSQKPLAYKGFTPCHRTNGAREFDVRRYGGEAHRCRGALPLPVGVRGKTLADGLPFWRQAKDVSFGAYPAASLKEAWLRRDKTKELPANDIDPGTLKNALKKEAEAAAREQARTFACDRGMVRHAAGHLRRSQYQYHEESLVYSLRSIGDRPNNGLAPSNFQKAARLVEGSVHAVRALIL